jgi:hypothetical protein
MIGQDWFMRPQDISAPLRKHVTLTHYVDANLIHDSTTGRSVTGIPHTINKMPLDWYSKKQATVETATYGSEFIAAHKCVEQVIEIRNTLCYLVVPICAKSYMFAKTPQTPCDVILGYRKKFPLE